MECEGLLDNGSLGTGNQKGCPYGSDHGGFEADPFNRCFFTMAGGGGTEGQ